MRQCTKCKEFLPLERFRRRGDGREGFRSWCVRCENETNIKRYHNSDKTIRRKATYKYNLKINYGLSVDEYNEMFNQQKGKCAICPDQLENRFLNITGKKSCVDHCHKTGKNRRILCVDCNKGLGSFKDNPELLRLAADYVENHYNRH